MSDLANVAASLQQDVAELLARISGLEQDLSIERAKNASLAAGLRAAEDQLAEKNATIARLQVERQRVWQEILKPDADSSQEPTA